MGFRADADILTGGVYASSPGAAISFPPSSALVWGLGCKMPVCANLVTQHVYGDSHSCINIKTTKECTPMKSPSPNPPPPRATRPRHKVQLPPLPSARTIPYFQFHPPCSPYWRSAGRVLGLYPVPSLFRPVPKCVELNLKRVLESNDLGKVPLQVLHSLQES